MRKVLLTSVTILAFCATALCKPQTETSDCDFARYKSLPVSHALLSAVVKRVKPTYPGSHMTVKHSETKVPVRIIVDRGGDVVEACAMGGHPLLRGPSVRAALEWKFRRNFGLSKRPRYSHVQSAILFTFRFNKH